MEDDSDAALHLLSLPEPILLHILSFLDTSSIFKFASTSEAAARICALPIVWLRELRCTEQ